MKLILIGPSGAGKGSLAEFIVRDYNIPHISTGQIFRDNMANKTLLGIEAEKYVNDGLFVPDEITVNMLLERLNQLDCANGFILDGYPRTLNQAELLAKKISVDHVIEMNTSDEIVIERLAGRYMCKKCQTIHNVLMDDVQKCKACGNTEMYKRDDDGHEQIQKRLSQYHAQIGPILDFYKQQGILVTILTTPDDRPVDMYGKFVGAL